MLFSIRSTVLHGLVALAAASPVPDPGEGLKAGAFKCPDGITLPAHDVRKAFDECLARKPHTVGNFPTGFSESHKVFGHVPSGINITQYPIVSGGPYTGGSPGIYRVVIDYNDLKGELVGVMQHNNSSGNSALEACKRIQDDEEDISDDSTSQNISDLETRAKKKPVKAAHCPKSNMDLSKDAVGAALKKLREELDHVDLNGRSYPHFYFNKEDIFKGVTKQLIEYPIDACGGTWVGGTKEGPGKYRVVADSDGKFRGVMEELAGNQMSLCDLVDEDSK